MANNESMCLGIKIPIKYYLLYELLRSTKPQNLLKYTIDKKGGEINNRLTDLLTDS